jgi:dihydroorotate dehydrogenase (NAD+) catalytic subunit
MNDLKTKFLGVNFENPLVLPSGMINAIAAHKRAEENGVGGVAIKSMTKLAREGNPLPRVVKYEHGYLNSVGLTNPGIEKGTKQLTMFVMESKIPVIASVFSTKVDEFADLAEKVVEAKPNMVELNLSCPNTVDELGKPLGLGVESTGRVVRVVRKRLGSRVKLIAKLSADVPDIGEVAKAAEAAGADAISAINTSGPGMVIDIKTRKPKLGNREGGMSGQGIRPLAIRCVYDIFEAVKLPIIGMGGVSDWQDVVEMMMAGGTLVGVGSATYEKGYEVFEEIKKGLREYLKKEKLKSLSSLVGVGH